MPSRTGPSNPGMNSGSTARNAAHPYANAQANGRQSKKLTTTTSAVEEKPQLSPTSAVSPSDTIATLPTRSNSKKKNGAGQTNTKSNRQQFSACHACRYRRVKCDLKDLGETVDPTAEISCTNCVERGIRCKDDYAESKKQLRRGKRINQLELEDNLMDQGDDAPFTPIRPRTTIPTLKHEFFDSPFYRRFYIQRPIIDPVEFRSRYVAWLQHQLTPDSNAVLSSATTPLSLEGQLLAKILVVWAAAYGVDESGTEQPENSIQDVQKRRIRVKGMLEEVIRRIDTLGLLRKPTWDGVRCLLLTLPLTEDALDNPMDRLTMYEAAIQQVYTLCQHDGVTTGLSPETRAANAMVRARIFWYAHVHEGLTTGLRGGRLLMDDDDLALFQRELPPAPTSYNPKALQTTNMTYSLAFQYATAPIRLASACRKVHAALTGPKARASKRLDGKKLEDTWESLALCWEEFESLRSIQRSDHVTNEDNTRFVDGWQIFLFECYNVIQEKIRDRLDTAQAARLTEYESSPDSPATVEGLIRDLNKYLAIAESKCFDLLDHVVHLIRRHLGSSFFAYDASLVRDGCFFAGHTLALMPGRDEDVRVCLQALSEMRWAFSKGNERSQSIRLAWRSQSDHSGQPVHSSPGMPNGDDRNSAGPSPRSDLSNHGGQPPPQQKRPRATPLSHTLTGPIQQQQLHVSSLPSHSAPRIPAPVASDSISIHDQQSLNQHRYPPQNGTIQRQDKAAASSTYVDRGIDQKVPLLNQSPTHSHPPRGGVSTQSSSSDGSSPPDMGAQPILSYGVPSKPPGSYDTTLRGYPPPSMDPHMFIQSPTHTNGHVQVYPPLNGHPSNMGATHGRLPNPQQYPPSFHPDPGHYQSSMPSNGMVANNFAYPIRQQTHAPPFGINATISSDELSRYSNGAEYFSQSPEVVYHPGVPVRYDVNHQYVASYVDNSHSHYGSH